MKPDIVVDVGNSRIKWGLCSKNGIEEIASLPLDDPAMWERTLQFWDTTAGHSKRGPLRWAVSGVQPQWRDRLVDWLHQRGHTVLAINDYYQLPIVVQVDSPEKVGIDRLFNAVASRSRALRSHSLIIDAGSAVTVDWVDASSTFRGGAIFPGFNLMTRALNEHTALLPLVQVWHHANPSLPGLSTEAAIKAGVFWAVAGGIKALIRQLAAQARVDRRKVFLTGGDAKLLAPVLDAEVIVWPEMTLEGIRLTAEAQP